MKISDLIEITHNQFPKLDKSEINFDLSVGDTPEWDSLGHFNLLLMVEQNYNIRFTIDQMNEVKSLKDIATILEGEGIES
tara:strand:- start:68 stop:307 length:240 start_codon:yes stop_codon:yes gene_type:complete